MRAHTRIHRSAHTFVAPSIVAPHAHTGGARSKSPAEALAVSPQGTLVLTGGSDCAARLWEADGLSLARELDGSG